MTRRSEEIMNLQSRDRTALGWTVSFTHSRVTFQPLRSPEGARVTVLTSPESKLQMQTSRPHPRPTES